jgi:short-subunit dehydrogenase
MKLEEKKAIVIGASSGIGEALVKVLGREGYEVGLVARRFELLLDIQKEIKAQTFVKRIDIVHTSEAKNSLESLIHEMGEVDLIILNAGILFNNREFDWEKEKLTIQTNVLGFSAMAHTAMTYFLNRKRGHLVGISSISALCGESDSPSYSASKAFVSNFLEGLRIKAFANKDIHVTDIKPGWVDTEMAKGEKTFWMASPEKAAEQIYSAIKNKRSHAYITRRWRLYAWFLKLIPRWLYPRLQNF